MSCFLCGTDANVLAALSPVDYPKACNECKSQMTPDASTWRWSCVGEYTFRLERANFHTEDDVIATIDNADADRVSVDKPTLQALMERLKPSLHDTLYAYYFEGKTFQEIGDELGMSKQAVHGRVNRAIGKLRMMAGDPADLDLGGDE